MYDNEIQKRKPSGGKRKPHRKRRKYEKDGYPAETVLGEDFRVLKRVRGGNIKVVVRKVEYASVLDPSTHKASKVKILRVVKNPASPDYERRGVITKGTLIETEKGLARVTSRPGQHGCINAILLK